MPNWPNLASLAQTTRAKLFKTTDVVSERIVKTLIMKYGIYTNIFAENI